jgi:DNA mismatch endonuclease, patch repair protein
MPPHIRDPLVTSRMMATVRNKNSRAELTLRSVLHHSGVRFRLHVKSLPGRPDLTIAKYRVAVFVDGDFWHGNAWKVRRLNRLEDLFPSRTDWWVAKIRRTVERDLEVTQSLRQQGWTVVRIWESQVLASPKAAADLVLDVLRTHAWSAPMRRWQ